MRSPNLFLIGAPRSGTTTLYHALSRHPDIFWSPVKEPWYYALAGSEVPQGARFPIIGVRDRAEYEALFAGAAKQRYVGEASTLYLSSKQATRMVSEEHPDARIIAILRDPVLRGFSNFMQHVRDGRETTRDYARALRLAPRRMEMGWSPFYDYERLSTYAKDVQRWRDAFGDRFLCLVYADLKQDFHGTLGRIWEFLGLPAVPVPEMRHNAAGIRRQRSLSWRVIQSDAWWKRAAKAALPERLHERTWLWLHDRSLRRVRLDARLEAELRRNARPDIRATERLLGRDLPHWHGRP